MPKKYQRKLWNAKQLTEKELARNGYARRDGRQREEQPDELNPELRTGKGHYKRKKMGSYVR